MTGKSLFLKGSSIDDSRVFIAIISITRFIVFPWIIPLIALQSDVSLNLAIFMWGLCCSSFSLGRAIGKRRSLSLGVQYLRPDHVTFVLDGLFVCHLIFSLTTRLWIIILLRLISGYFSGFLEMGIKKFNYGYIWLDFCLTAVVVLALSAFSYHTRADWFIPHFCPMFASSMLFLGLFFIVKFRNYLPKTKKEKKNMNPSETAETTNKPVSSYLPLIDNPDQVPKFFIDTFGPSSLSRYSEMLKWRMDVNIDDWFDTPHPDFALVKRCYPNYIHGRSKEGQVVCYELVGQVHISEITLLNLTGKQINDFFLFRNEFVLKKIIDPNDTLSQFVVILDVKGISLSDLKSEVLNYLKLNSFTTDNYYPKKVKRIIIINAASWFAMTFRMISTVLSEATREKIKIISASNMNELSEFIDDAQLPKEYCSGGAHKLGESPDEINFQRAIEKVSKMSPSSVSNQPIAAISSTTSGSDKRVASEAHLGEENRFHYDYERKRWIMEDEANADIESGKMKSFPNSDDNSDDEDDGYSTATDTAGGSRADMSEGDVITAIQAAHWQKQIDGKTDSDGQVMKSRLMTDKNRGSNVSVSLSGTGISFGQANSQPSYVTQQRPNTDWLLRSDDDEGNGDALSQQAALSRFTLGCCLNFCWTFVCFGIECFIVICFMYQEPGSGAYFVSITSAGAILSGVAFFCGTLPPTILTPYLLSLPRSSPILSIRLSSLLFSVACFLFIVHNLLFRGSISSFFTSVTLIIILSVLCLSSISSWLASRSLLSSVSRNVFSSSLSAISNYCIPSVGQYCSGNEMLNEKKLLSFVVVLETIAQVASPLLISSCCVLFMAMHPAKSKHLSGMDNENNFGNYNQINHHGSIWSPINLMFGFLFVLSMISYFACSTHQDSNSNDESDDDCRLADSSPINDADSSARRRNRGLPNQEPSNTRNYNAPSEEKQTMVADLKTIWGNVKF